MDLLKRKILNTQFIIFYELLPFNDESWAITLVRLKGSLESWIYMTARLWNKVVNFITSITPFDDVSRWPFHLIRPTCSSYFGMYHWDDNKKKLTFKARKGHHRLFYFLLSLSLFDDWNNLSIHALLGTMIYFITVVCKILLGS